MLSPEICQGIFTIFQLLCFKQIFTVIGHSELPSSVFTHCKHLACLHEKPDWSSTNINLNTDWLDFISLTLVGSAPSYLSSDLQRTKSHCDSCSGNVCAPMGKGVFSFAAPPVWNILHIEMNLISLGSIFE